MMSKNRCLWSMQYQLLKKRTHTRLDPILGFRDAIKGHPPHDLHGSNNCNLAICWGRFFTQSRRSWSDDCNIITCMLTKFKDSEFTKHLTPFVLGCLRCVLEMVMLRNHTVLFWSYTCIWDDQNLAIYQLLFVGCFKQPMQLWAELILL